MKEETFFAMMDALEAVGPKKIILAISPGELEHNSIVEFKKRLLKYQNLSILWNTNKISASFTTDPAYQDYPNKTYVQFTGDSSASKTMRRILLYYEMNPNTVNEDFVELSKSLQIPLRGPEFFKDRFIYLESPQAYMKIWPVKSMIRAMPNSILDIKKDQKILQDKIVVMGTSDTYGMMSTVSIYSRKDLFSTPSQENGYWSDADMFATYLINLYSGDYVRTPPFWMNAVWLSLWFLVIICTIWFVRLPYGFIYSFLEIFIFLGISAVVFRLNSLNLDLTRGVWGSIIIQYILIPFVFFLHMRKENAKKIEREKEIERERFKTRFVVKAARADMNMQLAARVSHDIRSPLMALQVAANVLKGKIAADVETLVGDSVARLKFIADDVLKSYRHNEKPSDGGIEWIDLREQTEELLQTYFSVHRQVQFLCEVPSGLSVYVPRYVFQRSLANLLNNSIEAAGAHAEIKISAAVGEYSIQFRVSDNGPGIPIEIREKLFKERSTFGKQQGTGLGLFQVRRDLSVYGARVSLQESGPGATFEIAFPKSLTKIPFEISRHVLVIESEKSMFDLFAPVAGQIELRSSSSVQAALDLIRQHDADVKWTVFVDMVLASEEETGFDFIENVPAQIHCKIILCSSFADNEEVQQLALKYQSLLVTKNTLYQLDWKIHAD